MTLDRELGRAGVQQARRALAVEISREGDIYRTHCCGKTWVGWHAASEHVIENDCEGEA